MPEAELEDMLSVPWEHEGAMVDLLRKEGADESVQKAMVAAVRLAKGVEDDLPEPLRSVVEKLGTELYSRENKPLNKDEETGQDEKDDAGDEKMEKRDFSTDERKDLAASDKALPDGSYPIEDKDDLDNAIQAFGRAKDKGRAKAWIIRRAKALGATSMLPDTWGVSKEDPEPDEDETAEGKENGNVKKGDTVAEEVHVAVPVQKEDGTWDLSNVPDEAKPVWSAVLKSNEELGEKLAKSEERTTDLENQLRTREFVTKAEQEYSTLAPADELGPILKAASETLGEEDFTKLGEILKGAAERVEKGDLFTEMGRASLNDGSRTDAYSTAVAKADELIEKGDGLTKDAAIARVFESHPELYTQYLVEMTGGVS
jgi:hypothetical protein